MERQDETTEELARRLRDGDATAVRELYDLYCDRLYAFVFNHVDRQAGPTEEIVQEVWLTAVRAPGKYSGRSQPYTWLCAIALNKIKDMWRRKGREAQRRYDPPQNETALDCLQLIDSEPLPQDIVESDETKHLVRATLSSLPENYRQVLILKYVEHMSAREIAELLHKSQKAVESSLDRARLAFRDRIARSDR